MDEPEDTVSAPVLRVKKIDSVAQLEPYRAAYEALLARLPGGEARHYAIESLQACASLFIGAHDRPYFLLAWQGKLLRGVMPLLLETRRWPRPRRLHAWGAVHGLLGLDAELLVPPGAGARECMQAFATHLMGPAAHDFDVMELDSLREDGVLGQYFGAVFPQAERVVEVGVSHLIDLPASADAYRATLSASMLGEMRRCERRLAQTGQVEFCARSVLSDTELDEVMAIHSARQAELAEQGKERQPVFAAQRERDAMLRLMELDAHSGRSRHYLLKVDGRTVAFSLGFACADVLVWHTTAFAPAQRKFGPGRIVAMRMLIAEIERGRTRCVDAAKGTTQIKLDLANRTTRHLQFRLINPASIVSRWRCKSWAIVSQAAARLRAARQ